MKLNIAEYSKVKCHKVMCGTQFKGYGRTAPFSAIWLCRQRIQVKDFFLRSQMSCKPRESVWQNTQTTNSQIPDIYFFLIQYLKTLFFTCLFFIWKLTCQTKPYWDICILFIYIQYKNKIFMNSFKNICE